LKNGFPAHREKHSVVMINFSF